MILKNGPACLINYDQNPLQHVYRQLWWSNEIMCWFLSGDMLQEAENTELSIPSSTPS